jgi:hypothetical protein
LHYPVTTKEIKWYACPATLAYHLIKKEIEWYATLVVVVALI